MKDEAPASVEIKHEELQIKVDPGQTSIRLDKYLLGKMEAVSRSKIQTGIKNGLVQVNGKQVKSNYLIRPSDVIDLQIPRSHEDFVVKPQDIPLDIRYEDDDVMIIHKPPGMVVHPGTGNWDGTLVNGLAYYFGKKDLPIKEGNNADRPGLVHRIDKDTSGLLVIAKNEPAMAHLGKQFFDHSIEREYEAIMWGEPDELKGTIDEYIGRSKEHATKYKVYEDRDEGKHAITHYEVVEPLYYISRVRCVLETGRTHQIRVHLAHLGHPLFNDAKYGGNRVVKGTVFSKYKRFVENAFELCTRQALHARKIGFIHPTTGKRMVFEADLPADMEAVLEKWRSYLTSREAALKNL